MKVSPKIISRTGDFINLNSLEIAKNQLSSFFLLKSFFLNFSVLENLRKKMFE